MSWKCNWINETNYKISEQTPSSCKHSASQWPHSADSAVCHSCSPILAVWVTVGPFSGLRLNSPVNWLPTGYSLPCLGKHAFLRWQQSLKAPCSQGGSQRGSQLLQDWFCKSWRFSTHHPTPDSGGLSHPPSLSTLGTSHWAPYYPLSSHPHSNLIRWLSLFLPGWKVGFRRAK